jgi:hypothetical protein
METHFHVLLRTAEANLAEGMQWLISVYAQGFNERYGWSGHVFESRYHSVLVDGDGHLLHLFRYLALNPVVAGLVPRVGQWRWSSYPATVGLASGPSFLSVDAVLKLFHERDSARARLRLRAFVEDVDVPAVAGV